MYRLKAGFFGTEWQNSVKIAEEAPVAEEPLVREQLAEEPLFQIN